MLIEKARSKAREDVNYLHKAIVADLISAAGASFMVSPFITIVDRSIIENANGKRKLVDGIKQLSMALVQRPHQFLRCKEFRIVFGLYFVTYSTANAIDSVCEYAQVNNQVPKFVGTTAVNMSFCIYKDYLFTRMFGIVAPSKFPLAAIGLFAVRDSMTCAASFNAPSVMAKKLEQNGMEQSKAKTIAQLSLPAAIQLASTPLHLFALDLYNRKMATFGSRIRFVGREYAASTMARIGRIGPAFGIGGVGNMYIRDRIHPNGQMALTQ